MQALTEILGLRVTGVAYRERGKSPMSQVFLVFGDVYLELYTVGPDVIHTASHLRGTCTGGKPWVDEPTGIQLEEWL